ncbi:CPBP family intramembrane metalloprotease [Virgibacillus dakarensis]|uniref:CPBP family intramembrane glutamic endopeptidase n=1 Tax=Virgibacillus dakarensis TaxID=1917889 RepID=UPI000B447735|nr:type II CAAX endopeptidase family protein [Virgibacillus dakarensis]MBT2217783.1 CPBP family intramembrane metalloprotease [Virgibacillus dakarensis]
MTKRYWYVILTYIAVQFSGVVFAPLLYFLTPLSEADAIIYWTIISFIAGLIVILWIMKPEIKTSNQRTTVNWGYNIAWAIGGLFMAYFAQGIATTIETKLLGITAGSENTQMIMEISRATPLFIIIPALIAPILEEVIFRKIIFGELYKRMNFFFAALLSAFIFAIIHGEPEHILIYGSMGFVFAFVYVKTKRIIVPILVHMSLNSIVVILQLSLTQEEIEKMMRDLEQMQMILIGG